MRLAPFALALLLAAGCGDKKTTDNKGGEEVPAAKTPTAADKPAAVDKPAKRPPVKPVSKQEARARLDQWLATQNDGKFDEYKKQYALAMVGIKRVGDKKSEFDRNGWLADRGRMFKKKMKVEAANIELRVDQKPATVLFKQTWQSGTFKDEGPKRLTLIREGDQVLIAREEMLSSKLDEGHNPARDAIRAIDSKLASVIADEIDSGMGGMSGMARRYKVGSETLKIYEDIGADHNNEQLTIYLRKGVPFYISFRGSYGLDVEWDKHGGTAGRSQYVHQEFLLAGGQVTDAWMRHKIFPGEYPSGAWDDLAASPRKKLSQVIGDGEWYSALHDFALLLRDRNANADDYDGSRPKFDELYDDK